ncbi:MAG: hypothetical protein WAM24_21595, partial [Ignavibacteriaceae bacterium]
MLKEKFTFTFFIILFFSLNVFSQSSNSVILKDGLVINLGRPNINNVISPDPVMASVVTGKWEAPSANEKFEWADTTVGTWEKIAPDSAGWFKGHPIRNSYIDFKFHSNKNQFAILEQNGNSLVFVNGVEHSGNPYGYTDTYGQWEPKFNYSLIPVKLQKGDNEFLFKCRRGYFKAAIHTGKEGVMFNERDLTLPDLVVNKSSDTYGAVPIINATGNYFNNVMLKTWAGNSTPAYHEVSVVNPLSIF